MKLSKRINRYRKLKRWTPSELDNVTKRDKNEEYKKKKKNKRNKNGEEKEGIRIEWTRVVEDEHECLP